MNLDLSKLTEAELISMNCEIVGRIREIRAQSSRSAVHRFRMGDPVYFLERGPYSQRVEGVVAETNRTTIDIRLGTGQLVRAAAQMVQKIEPHANPKGSS